jgi:hypothetical protein
MVVLGAGTALSTGSGEVETDLCVGGRVGVLKEFLDHFSLIVYKSTR